MKFWIRPNDRRRDAVIDNACQHVRALPEDATWIVECKREKKSRTDRQNAWLWGVAYPLLVDATGHTPRQLHDIFCIDFFGPREVVFNGGVYQFPRRTTTTDEDGKRDVIDLQTFDRFKSMIQDYGFNIGCPVPDPDPFHGENKP